MLIGRKAEQAVLQKALESKKAEMIAVIGRRRVGKTFLVKSVYQERIIFNLTGLQHGTEKEQMIAFFDALESLAGEAVERPDNWLEIFLLLKKHLTPHLKKDQKLVLFFDELPWLATPASAFLRALAHFWNSWALDQNLLVVLCGSASSWIIQKVINDQGGLHNRVSRYIHLKPFTLSETEAFLESRHIRFTRYQLVQLYMALGGIPLYLEAVESGKSAVQNINDICFSETGLLKDEFNRLYPALFEHAHHHISMIRALATRRRGLSRTEIIQLAKVPSGSSTSRALEELEQSDFILAYHPFGKKKKDKLYRLIDEYSLFYLKFIEPHAYEGEGTFMQLSQLQEYKIWCGYAFENICMKHVPQIKKALGVAGVYTTTYSFYKKASGGEKGLQIDMLLERADRVINLFEIKFYDTTFVLTKAYARQLRERIDLFKRLSKTRHIVFLTLITPFGLRHNMHSLGLVDNVLTLDDLFD
ncbi:MAG: ATP-binding protein [Bacteroidetes bacterium]|nr:MAG: ATP-binding protein [Bacteroidota bacterium]